MNDTARIKKIVNEPHMFESHCKFHKPNLLQKQGTPFVIEKDIQAKKTAKAVFFAAHMKLRKIRKF